MHEEYDRFASDWGQEISWLALRIYLSVAYIYVSRIIKIIKKLTTSFTTGPLINGHAYMKWKIQSLQVQEPFTYYVNIIYAD